MLLSRSGHVDGHSRCDLDCRSSRIGRLSKEGVHLRDAEDSRNSSIILLAT
jgi:hypothetical protein